MDTPDSASKKYDRSQAANEAKGENSFQYIPPSEWILHTPPRQRVVFPRAERCAIQPAVICTTKKQSNIYELNPDIHVDLTGCSDRQNVQVDGRYMRHLASFGDKMDVAFNFDDLGVANQASEEDRSCSFYEKRVTLRPVKTVKKISRVNNFYRRDSVEGPRTTPNRFHLQEELETNVTIVERDGKYKIVDKGASSGEKPFHFNFRKNLFAVRGDEKCFDFDSGDLFNFQMK